MHVDSHSSFTYCHEITKLPLSFSVMSFMNDPPCNHKETFEKKSLQSSMLPLRCPIESYINPPICLYYREYKEFNELLDVTQTSSSLHRPDKMQIRLSTKYFTKLSKYSATIPYIHPHKHTPYICLKCPVTLCMT